jgi:hypothetical protein
MNKALVILSTDEDAVVPVRVTTAPVHTVVARNVTPHSPNSDRVWKKESIEKLSASIRRVNRRKAKGLAPYSTKEEMRQYELRKARNQRRTQRAQRVKFVQAHDNRSDVRSTSFLPELVLPTLRKRGARK